MDRLVAVASVVLQLLALEYAERSFPPANGGWSDEFPTWLGAERAFGQCAVFRVSGSCFSCQKPGHSTYTCKVAASRLISLSALQKSC